MKPDKKFWLAALALLFFPACGARRHAALRASIAERPSVAPSEPFSYPLKGAKLLSPFGKRNGTFHMGVDLQHGRKGGEPVLASRAGKVTFAKKMSGYGNIISLHHKDGYSTRYAHLKSFHVKTGDRVEAHQIIGVVGKTGRASTPHLHFEVITPEGKFIDPLIFLNQ